MLSISTQTNELLFGNNTLRIVIKQGNITTNQNTILTDFIPLNEKAYYYFRLGVC